MVLVYLTWNEFKLRFIPFMSQVTLPLLVTKIEQRELLIIIIICSAVVALLLLVALATCYYCYKKGGTNKGKRGIDC